MVGAEVTTRRPADAGGAEGTVVEAGNGSTVDGRTRGVVVGAGEVLELGESCLALSCTDKG
ncbi:MAG TPA: hypothetical protein VFV02_04665 [Acidimicrobiales bacterium]|nr:hypothetical protein [Acidimicrobiales bacterium]